MLGEETSPVIGLRRNCSIVSVRQLTLAALRLREEAVRVQA